MYTFLENKGERSLVIPHYFPECFISKRVGKKNLLHSNKVGSDNIYLEKGYGRTYAIHTFSFIQF